MVTTNQLQWLHHVAHKKLILFLALISCCLFSQQTLASVLNAFVDKNTVQVGQFIQFSISLSGKSASGEPDFSALKQDFDIVGGASRSSETRIINGRMTSSSTWTITIAPKHHGAMVIPPIRFAGETTQPITVVVGAAPAAEEADAFFETQLSSDTVYVQAQLILDSKLYIKVADLSNSQLEPLKIENAQVIANGEARQSQVVKNGIRYFLVEQQYFIFPEQSGQLTIPALRFSAVVNEGISRFGRYGNRRQISATTPARAIEVKPIPASYPQGVAWLPAEEITLTTLLNPDNSFKVGEPVTQTVITRAKGLTASSLPPIQLQQPENVRMYPDQGTQENHFSHRFVEGIRKDAFAMIANRSGKIILPEYQLVWWDTKNEQLRYSTIKQRELLVAESGIELTAQQATPSHNLQIHSDITLPLNEQYSLAAKNSSTLIWITTCFLLLWLLTVLFFIVYLSKLKKRLVTENSTPLQTDPSIKIQLKEIHQSCQKKDWSQLRNQLIRWGQLLFKDSSIKGLDTLSMQCEDETLAKMLTAIDKKLFSTSATETEIDTHALMLLLKNISSTFEEKKNAGKMLAFKSDRGLAELYSKPS